MSTTFSVSVYWEDTDASGVVYHANYLRWFERARSEWLRQLGFSQQDMLAKAGIGFTVATVQVRYLKPARLDDELLVKTRVSHVGKASIIFEQEVAYAKGQEAVLATAAVRVGCVGVQSFRPQRIPVEIEDAFLKELENVD